MESRLGSARLASGLDGVDRAVRLLEEEWRQHGDVQLERVWHDERRALAGDEQGSLTLLVALIKADLRHRFERGQAPTVESYLSKFPELNTTDDRVLSLVYEEFCLSEENGRAPDVDAFCKRYPDWKSSLVSQLQYHRLLSQAVGPTRPSLPPFPKAGDNFEEFSLVSALGEGGMSRVFLAADQSLGGKQVVLKVTLDRGQEPKVQGSLDHPHIVPLNSVSYQTGGELCGLSMPYRRGLPLDKMIKRIAPASHPKKAIAIWKALVEQSCDAGSTQSDAAAPPPRAPKGDGWAGFPVNGTYPEGVAWIVMVLARALDYAHSRRTFHRDVKPANVLVTVQQGPQLLDFNLAESPHAVDHAQAALHGGTLPYMAPEQIQAFLNPQLWGQVDGQADIYSLGLVLRELLTGQMPELPERSVPPTRAFRAMLDRRPCLDVAVRRHNPDVPHSLEAIVARCLALKPADRYADARQLADDVQAFLVRRPLPHAKNPSRAERLCNRVVRYRRVMLSAASLLLIGSIAPVAEWLKPPVEARAEFRTAVQDIERGKNDEAARILKSLEKSYPKSSLVKFCLSRVVDSKTDVDKQRDADRYMRAALAAEDADTTLLKWAGNHSEVLDYLLDFAELRIVTADTWAEQWDNGSPMSDAERTRWLRDSPYGFASDALNFAVRLDATSPTVQRLLATTEVVRRQFASSYERLSRLIASDTADHPLEPETRFFCQRLRGRVAFLWADSLRKSGQRVDEATLARLQGAVEDCKQCIKMLIALRFDLDPELKEYHARRDLLRATLTLAEAELELSLRESAAKHLRASRAMLPELQTMITVLNSGDEPRVPAAVHLEARCRRVGKELSETSGVAGAAPPLEATEPPQAEPAQPTGVEIGR